jgi:hypothetical protein
MVNRRAAGRKGPIWIGKRRERREHVRADHRPQEIRLAKVQVNGKGREAQAGTGHIHPCIGSSIDEAEVHFWGS